MKNYLLLCFALFLCATMYGQTSLQGKVTDATTGEAILFGSVALYKNDVLVTGTETDLDGNFFFSDLDPGSYDVEASYVGYTAQRITGVIVNAGKSNKVDMTISEGELIDEVVIVGYKVPLIEIDNTTQGGTVTSETIKNLPTKDIGRIAATTAGVSSIDNGDINIRGARTESTVYYIDGVRVNSASMIPQSEVEQLQIITGGLGAEYGDVIGGAISVTSKGPSNKFSGGLEVETGLDGFGYNLLSGYASGPILKNSQDKSILGYRFSGQLRTIKDDSPNANGQFYAPEDVISRLEENPLNPLGGTNFSAAEFLSDEDIGEVRYVSPNEENLNLNFTGKLDARLSDAIDISISASMDDNEDKFSPSRDWAMLNWQNNPTNFTDGYRGNFRFRHKIGGASTSSGTDEEKAERLSTFRNASYTIQVGYERRNTARNDARHGDNLFNYGYYGNQAVTYRPQEAILSDPDSWGGEILFDFLGRPWGHQGYLGVQGEFTPNDDINGALSKYNTLNGNNFAPQNDVWASLFDNVGQVYNLDFNEESNRYTIDLNSSFDILPGGSESGRHNLKFGISYEQRVNRRYTINPRQLWNRARLNTNRHLTGVDTTNIIGEFVVPDDNFFLAGQTMTQYGAFSSEEEFPDSKFFRSIRELTGQATTEYVNLDGLDPNTLSLSMFAPGELIEDNNLDLNYMGYDYLGNKVGTDVTFDEFFTGRDSEGRRSFLVAPQVPIYGAAYLQDKFTYKDIIFRVGLRIDYYDANTKVLKDPYSLYEIEEAGDFYARTGQEQPGSVENDYSVYISGPESESVVGFRKDDQWFLPDGTSVSSGGAIFGGGVVTPAIKGATEGRVLDIGSPDFDTSTSFEDYEPQVNFSPRLSFSFPISEDAGFFAHYDVLTQRPTTNTRYTALDYLFFVQPREADPRNNPDLKPQQTVDFEVGFKQKLSDATAITLSAYTKEYRSLITQRFLRNTYPLTNYTTYDNLDFGTTTGFLIKYEMRRTNNVRFDVNYTLQFANGSGSDADSSDGLNSQGNIRTLSALDFDERHALNVTVDYRFGSGKSYNGPRIGDKAILEDFGVNLLMRAASGRPYSQSRTASERGGSGFLGGFNEARLPWNYSVDLQANKSITLNRGENGRGLNVDFYVRVLNLFDIKNVIGVYSFSGDPDSDGYLLSTFGQDRFATIDLNYQRLGISEQQQANFEDAYNWRAIQPGFYTLPRRIFVGAILSF